MSVSSIAAWFWNYSRGKSWKREGAAVIMAINLHFLSMGAHGNAAAEHTGEFMFPFATGIFVAAFGFQSLIKQYLPASKGDS